MPNFEIIGYAGRVNAIVLHGSISIDLRQRLYELLPTRARMSRELALRWDVQEVLCAPDWEHEQLHRVPALPIHGIRLCVAETEPGVEPVAKSARRNAAPRSWRDNVWRR